MNCQPGDLAISISTELPENLGRIVRVVRRYENTPEWNYGTRLAWWCECSDEMVWYFHARGEYRFAKEGPIPDDALRPIRPAPPVKTGEWALVTEA
jgi:hypothetical protein